jgi:hypothetical protein
MSPKILSEEKREENGIIKMKRIIKDEILGNIELVLTITPHEVSLKRWSAWGYGEKRLRRVELLKPYKGVNVVLAYDYGFEGEGHSHWRGVDIVPRDPSHVDRLLSQIRDFDTFADTLSCLNNVCKGISTHNVVECDISQCL